MNPNNEHEDHRTLSEDCFYPGHDQRTESPTFRATKAEGHRLKLPCAISGHTDKVEYHHLLLEWAFSGAVDWQTVKDIGTGKVTRLPVLDIVTDQPTGETFPVEHSLIYLICQFAKWRGFDWEAFDPAKPETFVDSMANMLPLHEKFHRAKGHGLHMESLPVWIFQAFPRVPGFIYSPDELQVMQAAS